MNTIIAALDFSSSTESVVSAAAELARGKDAPLILLHVVPEPSEPKPPLSAAEFGAHGGRYPEEEWPETALMSEEARLASARLKNTASSLSGINVDTVLIEGEAAEEIVRFARDQAAGVIVMGMPRRHPIYEWITGGTLQGVLKNTPCRVLLVPSPAPS